MYRHDQNDMHMNLDFYKLRFEHGRQRPTFPEVDPSQLKASANAFQPLMEDGQKVLHEFSTSEDFAHHVMDAAQRSQTEKMKSYIKATGVLHRFEIHYNPDRLQIIFVNQTNETDCCQLTIALKW